MKCSLVFEVNTFVTCDYVRSSNIKFTPVAMKCSTAVYVKEVRSRILSLHIRALIKNQ